MWDMWVIGEVSNMGQAFFYLGNSSRSGIMLVKLFYRPSPRKLTIFIGGMFTIPKWFVYYDYINAD
jgi:hypothetical protein